MANSFKRKVSRDIGTALTSIGSYTVAAGVETTCIGLTLANTTTSQIEVDVTLNDGTNDTFMIENAPIPVGSSLVVVGDLQKVVMEPGDSLKVRSDTASSVDAIMSILEID